MNFTGNRSNLRTMGLLAFLIAAFFWLWFAFRGPDRDAGAFGGAAGTKTALALTSDALLGPFPTSTVPTQTPSDIPTITSTIPTATPSSTRTPTPTASFLPTATLRTRLPGSTPTSAATLVSTSTRVNPTRTFVPRTSTPVPATDTPEPPPPTSPLPTRPLPTIDIPLPTALETLVSPLP